MLTVEIANSHDRKGREDQDVRFAKSNGNYLYPNSIVKRVIVLAKRIQEVICVHEIYYIATVQCGH